jgi:hypothetical protein
VANTATQLICSDLPDGRFALTVQFQERLHVLLQAWPSSVTLKIYEVVKPTRALARATRTCLAEVPLDIPGEAPEGTSDSGPRWYDWESMSNAALPLQLEPIAASAPEGPTSVEQANGASRLLQVVAPAGMLFICCQVLGMQSRGLLAFYIKPQRCHRLDCFYFFCYCCYVISSHVVSARWRVTQPSQISTSLGSHARDCSELSVFEDLKYLKV